MVEQKAVIEHTDLPKATPTETDDPDRVVSPNETERPKEEEPKVTTVPTQASTPSIAAEATAPPTLQETPEATFSVAPSLGTGDSARRERATWQKELAVHLNKYKRYPEDRVSTERGSHRKLRSRSRWSRGVKAHCQRFGGSFIRCGRP